MSASESEMKRLLKWVSPKKLAQIQSMEREYDRNRALNAMLNKFEQAKGRDRQSSSDA